MAVPTATLTIAAKYGIPQFNENNDFDQWENEVEIWKMVTDLPAVKQGPVTYLSLSQKVKTQCGLTKETLAARPVDCQAERAIMQPQKNKRCDVCSI